MEKAKKLAILILKDDPNWTPKHVNEALNGGSKPFTYLKTKSQYKLAILLPGFLMTEPLIFIRIYTKETTA
jgi:hypothetical protein